MVGPTAEKYHSIRSPRDVKAQDFRIKPCSPFRIGNPHGNMPDFFDCDHHIPPLDLSSVLTQTPFDFSALQSGFMAILVPRLIVSQDETLLVCTKTLSSRLREGADALWMPGLPGVVKVARCLSVGQKRHLSIYQQYLSKLGHTVSFGTSAAGCVFPLAAVGTCSGAVILRFSFLSSPLLGGMVLADLCIRQRLF
jgi:hypothetical protein